MLQPLPPPPVSSKPQSSSYVLVQFGQSRLLHQALHPSETPRQILQPHYLDPLQHFHRRLPDHVWQVLGSAPSCV